MCSSHIWNYLFAYCVLYGNNVLDGCDDYIICTTNWYIQSSLEFRKWLVYEDFSLKYTKLLIKLPRPSRKQSNFFVSPNSNLVFSTCSVLFERTDPLVCIVLVFSKELNKSLLYFFLKSLFFAMLGILSNPLCCWLKWTAPAHYRRVVHSWRQFCHLNR